jgi:hypothetical protein
MWIDDDVDRDATGVRATDDMAAGTTADVAARAGSWALTRLRK